MLAVPLESRMLSGYVGDVWPWGTITTFTLPVAAALPTVGTATVKVTALPYVDGLGAETRVNGEAETTSWLSVFEML